MLPTLSSWAALLSGILIDIGCGDKPYVSLLERYVKTIIGVDLPGVPSKADIKCDAICLPFNDSTIDAALGVWVMDDFPEPIRYLREVWRILKPSGWFIMVECQGFPIHNPPNDYYRFTKFGLSYLAQQAGFSVKQIKPIGGFWSYIGILLVTSYIRSYLWGLQLLRPGVRLLNAILNLTFAALDRFHFVERASYGYCVLLQKEVRP
jgi:SAM-dependent methyltransferase